VVSLRNTTRASLPLKVLVIHLLFKSKGAAAEFLILLYDDYAAFLRAPQKLRGKI
jgi:hypothetical protein